MARIARREALAQKARDTEVATRHALRRLDRAMRLRSRVIAEVRETVTVMLDQLANAMDV